MIAKPNVRNWVLTPHAAQRAVEREVSVDEIEGVIREPDYAITQGPKWILAKSFPRRQDNKVAAVLLEKAEENLWVVITVLVRFDVRKK